MVIFQNSVEDIQFHSKSGHHNRCFKCIHMYIDDYASLSSTHNKCFGQKLYWQTKTRVLYSITFLKMCIKKMMCENMILSERAQKTMLFLARQYNKVSNITTESPFLRKRVSNLSSKSLSATFVSYSLQNKLS